MKAWAVLWVVCAQSLMGGPVVHFTNQFLTFSTVSGKRIENARLVRLDEGGLLYSYTNTIGGGRVDVFDLSPVTIEELGIANEVAALRESASAQRQKGLDAARAARARAWEESRRAEEAKGAAAVEAAISENTGRGKVYEEFSYSAAAVEIKVGVAWALMTLNEKTVVASAALAFGRAKHPGCDVVRIRSVYDGKILGRYFLKHGLDLN